MLMPWWVFRHRCDRRRCDVYLCISTVTATDIAVVIVAMVVAVSSHGCDIYSSSFNDGDVAVYRSGRCSLRNREANVRDGARSLSPLQQSSLCDRYRI